MLAMRLAILVRSTLWPACVLSLAVAAALPPLPAPADEPVGIGEELSLEDQLKTGLKVRRPEDADFVSEVARRVQNGSLPRKLVDSTYTWAVRRRQKYPFPAFEQALRLQAERLGVEF
jgi:hypothetical protein